MHQFCPAVVTFRSSFGAGCVGLEYHFIHIIILNYVDIIIIAS